MPENAYQNTSPGGWFGMSSEGQMVTRWSNRMFRGCCGDVGWDFLGTFWEPIFAGWVIACKHVFEWKNVVYQENRKKEIFSKLWKIT